MTLWLQTRCYRRIATYMPVNLQSASSAVKDLLYQFHNASELLAGRCALCTSEQLLAVMQVLQWLAARLSKHGACIGWLVLSQVQSTCTESKLIDLLDSACTWQPCICERKQSLAEGQKSICGILMAPGWAAEE